MRLIFTNLLILLASITFVHQPLIGQIKGSTAEEKQKNADKKKEQQRIEELEAIEKGKKRHEKLQEKETRKRMKKNRKKADRINANKKPTLWERLTTKFRGKKV